jgi:CRP-like cAMP-binding protein
VLGLPREPSPAGARFLLVADENLFLRELNAADREALQPHLSRAPLRLNKVIAEDGGQVRAVHLPINCILSVITVMRDGREVESRTIGRESGFGLLHALGSPYSYERVEVQVGGDCWFLPVGALAELAAASPSGLRAIVRFAQATIVQSSTALACNSLHAVEQRLARWLLLTQDRLTSDILPLTQEHLAIMLAVQRTTVTAAAAKLQEMQLIRYSRGKIQVLDRPGLRRASCECYEQIDEAVQRLIGAQALTGA